MCGIVGYIGTAVATEFLLEGLRRLEYRGYDSAGIATLSAGNIAIRRAVGRIEKLASRITSEPALGSVGIGHTRWATHGPATVENAHPHLGGDGICAVVHNGVVENFQQLREDLTALGYQFR
ncbi:MAG: glutamine--fructose-6-phosphate aminotransferase, partial [Saprospiraceae bacterium]|nr:glutamine--fructose-6-phosphate aminotransferase [Saprospiraceae bacterium]